MLKTFKYGSIILGLAFPLITQAQYETDISFINPPTLGTLCQNASVTAFYTIFNNTPKTLKLTYMKFAQNDVFPAGSSVVVAAPVQPCGSTLASQQSCEIGVQLTSTTVAGTFNRTLDVGIDTREIQIGSPNISAPVDIACTTPPPTPPESFVPTVPVTYAAVFNSSILGAATVTNTGPSIVSGDLDLTPGSSVTGFPPGVIVNGVLNIDNTAATNVRTQATTYLGELQALPCSATYGVGQDISALSPINCSATPVICFSSSATMTGPVVLNGAPGDSCTFITGSTLTVSSNATMTTAGGMFNDNVNWAIGSSATLGTGSTLVGIMDAQISVTLDTGAILNGRAWSLTGAVSLDTNTVNPQG